METFIEIWGMSILTVLTAYIGIVIWRVIKLGC